ncbi:ABC transporter ATP-binding protein [Defluviitalea phaphyphila]|uniref:ABC transporter ATP-binding protein n=1 Tax=Defluviitalea phaphyphila TaxID=1473580 RepID=UPI00072FE0CF|nr:ABC transporter ATP-binding protein [Defluviitalea phaphyphila]
MVEVKNIKKVFKLNKKQMNISKSKNPIKIAVDDVSFKAKENEIFGLLGPNGAGKTTTLRCMATLIKPTKGEIIIQGYDVIKKSQEVRKKIAFLTNELKLDTHFTPLQTMDFFGSLYGLSKEEIRIRTEELFEEFNIKEFQNLKIEKLSMGMKQKLSIAVSLVHDPEVVIFDEPTNGLDIITARVVTEYLKKLKKQGKVVIISTHIMTEAEKLCDRIGILIDGKIRTIGSLEEILDYTKSEDLEDAFFKLYKQYKKEEL